MWVAIALSSLVVIIILVANDAAITLSVYSHKIPRDESGKGLLDELMPAAAE